MGITYEPFKGRSMRAGDRVAVYRNLKFTDRVVWSVAVATATGGRGEVLGHVAGVDGIALTECVVREKASRQQAIQAGGYKEVCGWVEGTLAGAGATPAGATHVTYCPEKRSGFFESHSGAAWSSGPRVVFTDHLWAI